MAAARSVAAEQNGPDGLLEHLQTQEQLPYSL
jgi:hypothetical protein